VESLREKEFPTSNKNGSVDNQAARIKAEPSSDPKLNPEEHEDLESIRDSSHQLDPNGPFEQFRNMQPETPRLAQAGFKKQHARLYAPITPMPISYTSPFALSSSIYKQITNDELSPHDFSSPPPPPLDPALGISGPSKSPPIRPGKGHANPAVQTYISTVIPAHSP
jgi:hypothetical protein